uniref:Uncharacterized protein n=1 Tax=uncultured Thermoplasmata archaeon TaxID=376542 RepID=A0A871Y6Y8_9ARCH|nr:hypothetical protein HULAa36F11_00014 [uncultured Thermoplasmata archaeon]
MKRTGNSGLLRSSSGYSERKELNARSAGFLLTIGQKENTFAQAAEANFFSQRPNLNPAADGQVSTAQYPRKPLRPRRIYVFSWCGPRYSAGNAAGILGICSTMARQRPENVTASILSRWNSNRKNRFSRLRQKLIKVLCDPYCRIESAKIL